MQRVPTLGGADLAAVAHLDLWPHGSWLPAASGQPQASAAPISVSATRRVMPTRRALKRLAVGERVQDPLLVLETEQRKYGEDKECTVLTLGNATGRLPSRPFWSAEQATVVGIARGDVVQVIGEVDAYRGKRQLNVTSIRVL